MPNQVALRLNQRLFSVFKSSASVVSTGGSAAGSSLLAASVVAGSSVLAVFLIKTRFVKVLRVLCRGSETKLRYHARFYPPVRQLFRAVAWLCNWLLADVCDGGRFTVTVVCLPAKSKEMYRKVKQQKEKLKKV